MRAIRRIRPVQPPARAHGWLPHRIAPRQGPRRRGAAARDDSGSAGLSRMSEEGQPRQSRLSMDLDIVCVGFGPAMGGFLTTLARDADPNLQVICYELADDIGFGVSGAVTRARGIRASFPDLDPAAARSVLERRLGERRLAPMGSRR